MLIFHTDVEEASKLTDDGGDDSKLDAPTTTGISSRSDSQKDLHEPMSAQGPEDPEKKDDMMEGK